MRDLSTTGLTWLPAAREAAQRYGIDELTVLGAVRFPGSVTLDPSSAHREWTVERRRRGDVIVVVAFPDDRDPIIWGVYMELPMESSGHKAAGGSTGTALPKTLRELRHRIVAAGLVIEAGRTHDRVVTREGRFLVSLAGTPSDKYTIPNTARQLMRLGFDVSLRQSEVA